MNCIYITKKGTPCKFKRKMDNYCTRHHNIITKNNMVELTNQINNLDLNTDIEMEDVQLITNQLNNIDLNKFNCELCQRQFDIKNKICGKCLYCHLGFFNLNLRINSNQ